jgi:acetoin utilization deacetylase AcuC-like enzyme
MYAVNLTLLPRIGLPVFVNEFYSRPEIKFETIKKSAKIAEAIAASPRLSQLFNLCDPAERESAVREAITEIEQHVDPTYLAAIRTGEPAGLASSNGLGWDPALYDMVVHSTAGILSALREVQSGQLVAASLSSGLHHASPRTGSGFCTVNSLAIAALVAAREGQRVVILDLDAHCGGGTDAYLRKYPELAYLITHIDVSLSSFDRYAPTGERSYLEIANEDNYLDAVERALTNLKAARPNVVFYNAGVDIWPQVSPRIVRKRDAAVARMSASFSILGTKCVVVMAGGYGADDDIVPLHLGTLEAFYKAWFKAFQGWGGMPCPHCGGKVLPIYYGHPAGRNVWDHVERGEVLLGGCCFSSDNPQSRCVACGKSFRHSRN